MKRETPGLVADLGVRGVWPSQTKALFDIRVINTDTQFHAQRSVDAVLASAERVKRKYSETAMARHELFSPFVVSRRTNRSRGKSVYEAGSQVNTCKAH